MTRKIQMEMLNKIANENGKVWEEVILFNDKETKKLFKRWIKKAWIDEFDDMSFLIRLERKAEKNGFTKDRREW